jgi:hypothetical protein
LIWTQLSLRIEFWCEARLVMVSNRFVQHAKAHTGAEHASAQRPVCGREEKRVGELHLEESQSGMKDRGLPAKLPYFGRIGPKRKLAPIIHQAAQLTVGYLATIVFGQGKESLNMVNVKGVVVIERRNPTPPSQGYPQIAWRDTRHVP